MTNHSTSDVVDVCILEPETAADVIEWSVIVVPMLEHDTTRGVRKAQRWISRHILPDIGGWADMTDRERVAFVDSMLDIPEMVAVRDTCVESVSLPPGLYERLVEYFTIFGAGGCACPECREGKEIKPEFFDQFCRYAEFEIHVESAAVQVMRSAEPSPSTIPYWLHQAYQAKAVGMGRGIAERRRRRKEQREKSKERAQDWNSKVGAANARRAQAAARRSKR